ncbi:24088_t:CDS:2, partial [Racocetra persica]
MMDQLNNLTLWDVKDAFNKVKNVVMNYTEMEAKVREATNNEPWGASSTLMQEIAQGTYHYQSFNEIMTTIYKRFTEKEARQWRQIYKALQLLEYLVKHGAERVVDDARAHMQTVKMMRNFAYIDDKGKDQGVNVRNRARELAELLSDVEKIRQERRKAKANRTKYTGVSSDAIGYGSSSRYGGFGNDTFYYNEDRTRSRYDEPDSQWQVDYRADRSSFNEERRTSTSASRLSQSSNKNIVEPLTATTNSDEPTTANTEVNLFDFDDTPTTNTNPTLQNDFGAMQTAFIDDDFQDFQSAPLTTSSQRSSISMNSSNLTGLQFTSVPKPNTQPINNVNVPKNNANVPQANNNLLDDLLGPVSPVTTTPSTGLPMITPTNSITNSANQTHSTSTLNSKPTSPTTPKQNSTNTTSFPALKSNDIWAQASNLVSLDSLGKESKTTKQPAKPSMNSLAQANSSSWAVKGTWTGAQPLQQNSTNG